MRSSGFVAAFVVVVGLVTAIVVGFGAPEVEDPEEPQVLRYLVLGDSIATGEGAERSYPARYREEVAAETGAQVRLSNLAVNGWTSADLLSALREDPEFATAVDNADLITFNIGGNDLLAAAQEFFEGTCEGVDCVRDAVDGFTENWDAIIGELPTDGDAEDPVLATMDVYNPFTADLAVFGVLDLLEPFLDEVNDHIADTAGAHDIPVVGVRDAFHAEGDPADHGLIADDRLHPSDDGHALIAELLADLELGAAALDHES